MSIIALILLVALLIPIEPFDDPKEDFLGQLLGGVPAAGHPEQVPVDGEMVGFE